MKKSFLFIVTSCMLGTGMQAQDTKQFSAASAQSVVNASVSGPANVCPNDQNVLYNSGTNVSGLNYWVEFKCGGAGVIVESGTQNYIINNTGNNNSCHVNWGNYNGSSSWVQAVYHWKIAFINYTATGTQNTDIGVISPTAISGPSAICSDDLSNFTVSCPDGIPTNAYAYHWTATNAAFVSGTSSSSATLHAAGLVSYMPITVSVQFTSYCGGYSGSYSYVISRPQGKPLGAGYVLQHIEAMGIGGNLLVDFTFPSKPFSYNWHAIVTEPSSSPVNYTGTVPANTTGYTQLSLVSQGATIYMNANQGNESCGNYWNYSYGKSGISEGTHNRMAHTDIDGTIDGSDNGLLVYPNPANDRLTISYFSENSSSVSLLLTNVLGKIVLNEERTINEGENELDLHVSSLPNGIYFLNLNNKGISQKRKIVIER